MYMEYRLVIVFLNLLIEIGKGLQFEMLVCEACRLFVIKCSHGTWTFSADKGKLRTALS